MTISFNDLGLSRELLKAIEDLGFEEPSPIQALAIPVLLAGRDAVAQAQTGTGKTAAFGLPVLQKVLPGKMVQALVLCPTRELAIQVAEELARLAIHRREITILPIYGGQSIERQFQALARGVQVIVGTPGRVLDHLQRKTISLAHTTMAILDEADEMLDLGFREDIETILGQTPQNCQRILLSATMPPSIRELARRFLREPEMLTIAQKMLTVPAIEQIYYEVRSPQKLEAVCRLLDSQSFRKALIFCSTRRTVDAVAMHLQQRGYQSDALHGNLAQSQRDRVMQRFRTEGFNILVATDVAARGLDVEDMDAVINYDIPQDVEKYVHRIGRTGRAGRSGSAHTFVTVQEHYKMRDIIRYTKARITLGSLPTLRDVHNLRTSRLLAEVKGTVDTGNLDRWLGLLEDFLVEHFPDGEVSNRDISAALLKMVMQRDFGNQDKTPEQDPLAAIAPRPSYTEVKYSSGEKKGTERQGQRPPQPGGPRPPMSRIQIDVGHTHQASPRDLVGAIAGESGIPSRSIGSISIEKNHSVVEIATELVEDVLMVLNNGVFICGTKITAKADAGKTPFAARKPFPAGARRQYTTKQPKKRPPNSPKKVV